MKLGLVTDSLVDRSLAEAAAVCRGLGLEQVELGCGNWSPAPHVDLKGLTADAGARHRLLDTLGENGLTISALNCSGNPLFPGEKGAGDRAVAEGTFLLAEQLGVETVVMMSGLPGGCPEDRTPTWIVTSWAAGDGGNPPLPVEGGRPGVEGAGRPGPGPRGEAHRPGVPWLAAGVQCGDAPPPAE